MFSSKPPPPSPSPILCSLSLSLFQPSFLLFTSCFFSSFFFSCSLIFLYNSRVIQFKVHLLSYSFPPLRFILSPALNNILFFCWLQAHLLAHPPLPLLLDSKKNIIITLTPSLRFSPFFLTIFFPFSLYFYFLSSSLPSGLSCHFNTYISSVSPRTRSPIHSALSFYSLHPFPSSSPLLCNSTNDTCNKRCKQEETFALA